MPDLKSKELDSSQIFVEVLQSERSQTSSVTPKSSPLFFGLGTLGYSIPVEAFSAFAYFYYVDNLGLAFSMAALVRTVYTISACPGQQCSTDGVSGHTGQLFEVVMPGAVMTERTQLKILPIALPRRHRLVIKTHIAPHWHLACGTCTLTRPHCTANCRRECPLRRKS